MRVFVLGLERIADEAHIMDGHYSLVIQETILPKVSGIRERKVYTTSFQTACLHVA